LPRKSVFDFRTFFIRSLLARCRAGDELDTCADRRVNKRLTGISSPQEEFHPARLAALGTRLSTAARVQGELPGFNGKAPVAHHSILLSVPDTDVHDGTCRHRLGLERDGRLQVAIAVDIGDLLPRNFGDVRPPYGLCQCLRAAQGSRGRSLWKEIARAEL
jgi:hypothetical protein